MASIRVERVRKKIETEVARIIQTELRDPRLGFVTVVGCELSPDYRHARLKVSVLTDKEAELRRVMRMLEDARGFIQRTVAGRLRTRVTPELSFVLDRSAEKSVRISSMLDELRREREAREGGGEQPLSVSEDLESEDEVDDEDADDDEDHED
ncbi:MAG: 30S ribosome-binding factor RbfA [Planctomycetes bacterium]|nr:30S ribosome-binding factor RbfA [Planctomycetota bacterium]